MAPGFCSSKWVFAEDAELGSGDGENVIWKEETKCSILYMLRCPWDIWGEMQSKQTIGYASQSLEVPFTYTQIRDHLHDMVYKLI